MYADIIKQKFPQDEKNGLYRVPQLPAVKLGKLLIKDTRISSPNDVLALHIYSSMFSSGALVLTHERCFYPDGFFELEDIKEVQLSGSKLTVFVNQQTQFIPHELPVKNEQVAKTLQRIFEQIAHKDPTAEILVSKTYEGYSHTELDWLNMRDEIMKTIDMLYERYNDGKLSLMEYEDKKDELLGRL